jgi:hypothetical protein
MSIKKANGGGLGGSGSPGGALASGGILGSHAINQSLRFNDNDSAHLTFTPASAGNQKTWTWSAWIKRGTLGVKQNIFNPTRGGDGSNEAQMDFQVGDGFQVYDSGATRGNKVTTRVFRDTSSWYHFVVVLDTTDSTADDRIKIYVNGTRETSFATSSNPGLNTDWGWNAAHEHSLGSYNYGTDSSFFDGYMAEVNFIDGTALDPTSFGETIGGVWVPKEYSGSYGTNGFYLPFSQDRTVSASAFFDQDDNSYVAWTDPGNEYEIGSSDDYTLELFFWPTATEVSGSSNLVGYYRTTSPVGYFMVSASLSSRNFYLYHGNGAATTFGTYTAGDVQAGRWHHLAFNRSSGTLRCFLDGAEVGSASTSNTRTHDIPEFRVNKAHATSNATFDGYVSNVRWVIGSAVYSDGSSITVPTSPLTAVTNTKILACTTTTITADASSNNVTGTAYGTAGSGYYATDGISPFPNSAFNEDAGSNGNDFSANNLLDTDVVPDSPTNNFPTLNAVFPHANMTFSEGNLKWTSSTNNRGGMCNFAIPHGTDQKYYFEYVQNAFNGPVDGDSGFIGINVASVDIDASRGGFATSYSYLADAGKRVAGSSTQVTYGSAWGAGDVIGVAIDRENDTINFAKNNTYQGTFSIPATTEFFPWFGHGGGTNSANGVLNFGQDSSFAGHKLSGSSNATDDNGIGNFYYAPPSGFLALCSANLPEPTISPNADEQADDYFDSTLYTGNGGTQSFVNAGSFQPDFVWQKNRSSAANNILLDSVRGGSKYLLSNSTSADLDAPNYMTFNSNGATFSSTDIATNQSGQSYVAWNWKAGGAPTADNSAAANAEPTAGSAKIDGSNQSGAFSGSPSIAIKRLSASTTAGFSIVTWTGTGSAGTIPHGLGAAPDFYVVKNLTDSGTSWQAYHVGIASDAETDYIYLNSTAAAGDADDWNDTAPTANVFSVKTHNQVNASGDEYLAYLFTSIEGFSKHASFVGNGDANGTFVYTGFRPAWVMIKRSSGSGGWHIFDNKRAFAGNEIDVRLEAQDSAAENTSGPPHMDFLSNGFKLRTTFDNINAGTCFFIAFAEAPFKFSNAR